MNNRLLITLGLVGLAFYLIKRRVSQKNDLQAHLVEERELQKIGDAAVQLDANALSEYPWTTFGDLPLAGAILDPFNPDNPASKPRTLDAYPGLIQF